MDADAGACEGLEKGASPMSNSAWTWSEKQAVFTALGFLVIMQGWEFKYATIGWLWTAAISLQVLVPAIKCAWKSFTRDT